MTLADNSAQRDWPTGVRITDLALSYQRSAALRAVAVTRIADHLADGPLRLEDLAARAAVSASHLGRILRVLVEQDVFAEVENGVFAMTEQSQLLRADVPGSIREGVIMLTDKTFWEPAGQLGTTMRNGQTVFSEMFGCSFFDHLERTGGASDFHRGMASLSSGEEDAVVAALPILSGSVVDVGGGHGSLLRLILLARQETTGVLYDREEAIAAHTLDVPELAGRWRTETGDFFDSVPAGADSYVLKRILHDWNDEDCVRLLTAIRRAIPDTGRVFVVDGIMPDDARPDPLRTFDLVMMSALDGHERHEREFRELFARSGFEFVAARATNWTMAVVEGRPVPGA